MSPARREESSYCVWRICDGEQIAHAWTGRPGVHSSHIWLSYLAQPDIKRKKKKRCVEHGCIKSWISALLSVSHSASMSMWAPNGFNLSCKMGPKWVCLQFPWWPHMCWVSSGFWLGFRWSPTGWDSYVCPKWHQNGPHVGPMLLKPCGTSSSTCPSILWPD